jgi:hypothetical protein
VNKLPILATGLFVLFTMAACGGGGSSSDSTFRVSTSVGAGGSVSPSSVSVTAGNTASFSVTPDTGYQINSVSGCGGALSGNTYTTAPITANCVVTASFSLNTYTVTATAGAGGSITPTSATVNHGSTVSFTVTPATGYTIDSVSGCGGSLSGNTFTTAAITGDCSVSASFRASGTTPPPPVGSFTVTTTTTGTGSGTISPTQAVIPQGQTATFQVVPSTGSTIASVTGCGGSLSGSTYTTGAINSNCVVTAAFTLNTYTVTATAGEGGSVSPESVTVNHGATVTLIATPDVDYGFASWTEGGATVSTSGTYTFTATSNRSLVANFRLNTELLNGRYDGVMKAPAPISVFDVDKAYTTFEITGRSIQIVQEHFYGETCIFVGEISETSVPLHASGTYQCSDFTTGTWSSTKIAKTAPDAFIAELEISGGRGDYVAKYNGFLSRTDVPDYYAELDPYFYDSGNVDDISGSYIGTLKSGESCAGHSFEISPADVEIVIQGSSIEITQDAFFEGTCIFTGNIADRSRVPLAASGDYMCSNFDVGTWSSDYIVLTGTDSFLASLAVEVPARGCSYDVAYSGFKLGDTSTSFLILSSETELDVGGYSDLRFVLRSADGSEQEVAPETVSVEDASVLALTGSGTQRRVEALQKGSTVVNAEFETYSATKTITVVNTPPVARFLAPEVSAVGATITFIDDSHDEDGDPLVYEWQLSGQPGGSQATLVAGSGPDATLVPDVAGTYEVTLTVRDARISSTPFTSSFSVAVGLSGVLPAGQFDAAGGPYLFTGQAEIAPDTTVSFGPGSIIYGQKNDLRVFGQLQILGSTQQRVVLDQLNIVPASDAISRFRVELSWCDLEGGSFFYPTGNAIYGSFSVSDCVFRDVYWMYLWYPAGPSELLRNVFVDSGPIEILLDGRSNPEETLAIENSVFVSTLVEVIEVYTPDNLAIKRNTFSNVGQVNLRLRPGDFTRRLIDATDNYWGTTDPGVIETMVFDENDDFAASGVITFEPFLLSPDASTPSP